MDGCASLPNSLAYERPRVEIVLTKHFLHNTTWSGAYGDIVWIGILQPNADTSEHRVTEHSACGLAAHAILEAA